MVILLTVQSVVSRLKSHLDESIRTEPMPLDEIAAISLKLQSLRIVLTDEVGDSGLCVAYTGSDFGCEPPFELLGRGLDIFFGLVWLGFG